MTPLCTSRFQIFLLNTDTEIPVNQTYAWNLQKFVLLQTVTASSDKNIPEGVKRKIQIHFEPTSIGFYLALLDLGSCTEIYRIAVYYVACQNVLKLYFYVSTHDNCLFVFS